jgi:hypothetical protein
MYCLNPVSLLSRLVITGNADCCAKAGIQPYNIKKKARVIEHLVRPLPDLQFNNCYPSAIASVGQEATQAPQSEHFAGSIQRLSSFSEIASTGHSLSHEPQFTHSSLIL